MKPPFLGRVQAVPPLCVLYPGFHLTNEEKSAGKTSLRVFKKCQLLAIQYVDMATF
jgi:hypothetical protein